MEHTADVISGNDVYVLLDEQRVAYERVLTAARKSVNRKNHTVIIIEGGPGTGKSVIALHSMASLLLLQKNVQHATVRRHSPRISAKSNQSRHAVLVPEQFR